MINLMSPRHQLTALIWAAIFMIAAQFVASSASAHSGHSHDHSMPSHSSSVTPLPHDSDAINEAQLIRSEKAEPSVSTSERVKLPAPSSKSGGCTGGCCGNGISCCGGAVLTSCSNCLPDFRTQTEIVSLAFEYRSGIDPEPLRRPPRTLA